MNEAIIVEMWNLLKEYSDKKQITSIATKFVDLLSENGVRENEIESALGHDDDLDEAIKEMLMIEDEDNSYDYDDE
jgi:hypothetical protein